MSRHAGRRGLVLTTVATITLVLSGIVLGACSSPTDTVKPTSTLPTTTPPTTTSTVSGTCMPQAIISSCRIVTSEGAITLSGTFYQPLSDGSFASVYCYDQTGDNVTGQGTSGELNAGDQNFSVTVDILPGYTADRCTATIYEGYTGVPSSSQGQ
jgi:hypothetical protein